MYGRSGNSSAPLASFEFFMLRSDNTDRVFHLNSISHSILNPLNGLTVDTDNSIMYSDKPDNHSIYLPLPEI